LKGFNVLHPNESQPIGCRTLKPFSRLNHVRNYAVGDAVAWFKRLKGFNVLHPIGWDSFGQPAEDAAVKRGVNPREWTEANIKSMQGQIERLGMSYDWSRQMAAHRPEFYKFDQWFFLKMYEMGLAYKKKTQVNWCETDQATLSNEQASGGLCWRCGNPVTKKDLDQWFLKTTAYTDQLLDDMAEIESGWPQNVIKRQQDWIGRSHGAFVDFAVEADNHIRVFTTRIDTIYGVNAIVVAAEHPVVVEHLSQFSNEVLEKIQSIHAEKMNPTNHEAEAIKDGIDTGLKAVNPFSGEELPVWIGNYVMMEYGTGAVMSVPAHDERDFEFAKKFGLPVRTVISPKSGVASEETETPAQDSGLKTQDCFTEYGVMVNSGEWNGKTSDEGKVEMAAFAKEKGFGEAATTYRLRDWGISRQRFWGSPIPMIYCPDCGIVPEKYENLPIELPENAAITGSGESPLAKVPEFYETKCPNCDGPAHRETDTMDTFVDSSWYFFRYLDPKNADMPFDPEVAAYWTPVDQYIGGDDHAVMHLIYARFWTKVMRDIGLVKFNEPFKRLLTQGMVVGETFFDDTTGKKVYHLPENVAVERDAKGKIVSAFAAGGDADKSVRAPLKHAIERMSKSKGNGVDPDEMVEIYGADATRLFVLFAAPVENELVWHESGIEGAVRFLQRVWRFVHKWHVPFQSFSMAEPAADDAPSESAKKLRQKTHQTIKRVDESLESLQFNTPVAGLMELINALHEAKIEPETASAQELYAVYEAVTALILMLTPFSPHIAEELFANVVGNDDGILANEGLFPEYESELLRSDEIEIAVQVNGKLRSRIFAAAEASNDQLQEMALADEKVIEHTAGKEIVKVVVVPKRLVNIVVR
ncbi:MAG TPA: leucine--tRNA ligase, partial [Pyrinomonadaceae bacterium]|nr:leucine--tRNA ligase [Pyrinomonadaceae bacterium]